MSFQTNHFKFNVQWTMPLLWELNMVQINRSPIQHEVEVRAVPVATQITHRKDSNHCFLCISVDSTLKMKSLEKKYRSDLILTNSSSTGFILTLPHDTEGSSKGRNCIDLYSWETARVPLLSAKLRQCPGGTESLSAPVIPLPSTRWEVGCSEESERLYVQGQAPWVPVSLLAEALFPIL